MSFVGTGGLCERAADSRGDPRARPLGIFAAHEFFTALADAPDPRFFWNEGADVAVVTGNDRAIGVDQRNAITPVSEKYPRVRFVAAKAFNGLGAAMSGA